jgi:addiction module HigA family antidote
MIRTKNLIHPGEILKEEFLDPMGISQNRLALDLHVPAPRVNAIVRGKRAITADTAVRLGVYFGTGPEFWQNLQSHYDLGLAQKKLDSERFSILPFLRTAAAL